MCGAFNVITRTGIQFRRIPEKKGIVVPSDRRTFHSNFSCTTRSPGIPFSERIAFKRDLVVTVCQPPSCNLMKPSPTSAIKLPCRKTKATPLDTVTIVLAFFHILPSSRVAMAVFIWRSILRMV